MLARDHTLTLPSSLHVAQWDVLGLKTTSFTCKEPAGRAEAAGSSGTAETRQRQGCLVF